MPVDNFEKLFVTMAKATNISSSMLAWDLFVEAIDEPENPFEDINEAMHISSGVDVVLVTGGLDSTILYYRAKRLSTRRIEAFYFNFGQPYMEAEIETLNDLGIDANVVPIDIGYDHTGSKWKHIIPARNLIAIDYAAKIAGKGGNIYFAVTHGESPERGGDKSQRFLKMIKEHCRRNYGTSDIITLLDGTKSDNIMAFLDDGEDRSIILKTYSCFSGENNKQCGRCQSCLRHYIALKNNNFSEKEILDKYVIHPLDGCTQYIEKYRSIMIPEYRGEIPEHYGYRRIRETLQVLAPEILEENNA